MKRKKLNMNDVRDVERKAIVDVAFALAPGLVKSYERFGLNRGQIIDLVFQTYEFTEEERQRVQSVTFANAFAQVFVGMLDINNPELPLDKLVGIILVEAARKLYPDSFQEAVDTIDAGTDTTQVLEIQRIKVRKGILESPANQGKTEDEIIDAQAKELNLTRRDVDDLRVELHAKGQLTAENLLIEMMLKAQDKSEVIDEIAQQTEDMPVPDPLPVKKTKGKKSAPAQPAPEAASSNKPPKPMLN